MVCRKMIVGGRRAVCRDALLFRALLRGPVGPVGLPWPSDGAQISPMQDVLGVACSPKVAKTRFEANKIFVWRNRVLERRKRLFTPLRTWEM